ncbi:hypothetical protein B7P43_G10740 [Cryptotermes secundus]|uniref:Uncharacterized protein n=1 Tax=Cryptotermes secundus TaxID=105785 RepID=A0A2J7R135_9NEOP|nr:hypothetical protein B7P43_G10740 [Cryptotermes secundus]
MPLMVSLTTGNLTTITDDRQSFHKTLILHSLDTNRHTCSVPKYPIDNTEPI